MCSSDLLADAAKDEDAAHPVAAVWRPVLCEIVAAFARRDYGLSQVVAGVDPISSDVADQIREYVADYGATLVELPEDTWETSISQWMGTHWEVLVDLWTEEEGPSDLVLSVNVAEREGAFRFTVHLVYVP